MWTFGEAAQKIKGELDLFEETFITPDELVGYFNDAIHEAETEILNINEDYLLASATLAMTVGQTQFDLPANIYAQKIRSLIYLNGSIFYEIHRIRGASKFEIMTMIQNFGPNDDYGYLLVNGTPGLQSKIQLVPASRDAGNYLTLWHIRNAQRIPTATELGIRTTDPNTTAQNNTVIDLPEAINFIMDFVKCKCIPKDGDPRFPDAVAAMEKQREMMVSALTGQVPDNDDTIMPDMSIYRTMS